MNPDEIIGRPSDREVWLAPDWSNSKPITAPQPKGWTRVSVRDTMYANGRIVTEVLDADRNPIKNQILDQQIDDKQAERFQREQQQGQRQTDQSERRVTSEYPSTYPAGHPQAGQPAMRTDYESGPSKYAPMPASAANAMPAGSYPRTEGTRLPDGTYDNSQPVQVWHAPDGSVVKIEPLTADERSRWEREKNQGAGVGAYTDTQVAENAGKNKATSEQGAVPGYPGWTQRTTKDASGELTLYYPPGQPDKPQTSLPEKPDAPTKPTYQTIKGGDGQEYIRSITIGADGKPVIQAYDGQGHPVAAIPGEKEPPKLTQTRGDDGQVYTTVTTIGADNKITVQTVDQQGKPVEKIPTKAPARERLQDPDTKQWLEKGDDGKWRPIQIEGQGETGNQGPSLPHVVLGQMKDGLTTFREDLTRQVGAGTLTPAVAERRWKEATDLAELGIRESSLLQQDEISRRSSDVALRTNAMSNGTSVFNNALDFIAKINPTLKVGSTAGARAFREILQMHQTQMESLGAYRNEFSGPSAARGAPSRGAAASSAVPGVGTPQADSRPPVDVSSVLPAGASTTTDAGGAPREYTPASSTNGASGLPPAAAPASPPSLFAGPGGGPAVDTGSVGISPDGSTAPVDVNRPLPTMDPPGAPTSMSAPEHDYGVLSAYQPMQAPVAPSPSPLSPASDAPLPGVLRAQQIANEVPWHLSPDDYQFAVQNGLEDHFWQIPARQVVG
jgi:hypothetical protein